MVTLDNVRITIQIGHGFDEETLSTLRTRIAQQLSEQLGVDIPADRVPIEEPFCPHYRMEGHGESTGHCITKHLEEHRAAVHDMVDELFNNFANLCADPHFLTKIFDDGDEAEIEDENEVANTDALLDMLKDIDLGD